MVSKELPGRPEFFRQMDPITVVTGDGTVKEIITWVGARYPNGKIVVDGQQPRVKRRSCRAESKRPFLGLTRLTASWLQGTI